MKPGDHTTYSASAWVYVLQSHERGGCRVGQSADLRDLVRWEHKDDERVVYLRPFADPLDALGHKLLLEQLSDASLQRLIQMRKPGLDALLSIVRKHAQPIQIK